MNRRDLGPFPQPRPRNPFPIATAGQTAYIPASVTWGDLSKLVDRINAQADKIAAGYNALAGPLLASNDRQEFVDWTADYATWKQFVVKTKDTSNDQSVLYGQATDWQSKMDAWDAKLKITQTKLAGWHKADPTNPTDPTKPADPTKPTDPTKPGPGGPGPGPGPGPAQPPQPTQPSSSPSSDSSSGVVVGVGLLAVLGLGALALKSRGRLWRTNAESFRQAFALPSCPCATWARKRPAHHTTAPAATTPQARLSKPIRTARAAA